MVRGDALLALALAFVGAVLAALSYQVQSAMMPDGLGPMPWFLLSALLVAAPLVVRRRWPSAAGIGVCVVYMAFGALGLMELTVSQVVVFLGFYSIGAWEANRRRAFWVRLLIVLAMGAWLLVDTIRGFTAPETGEFGVQAYFSLLALQWAINAAFFGGGWVFGDRAWRQAIEQEALERAQSEVRAQQALLTEQAISLERLRIARELHDVVAHHVSAMGIQAGAARRVMTRDSERAADALRSVEESSRAAIAELGTMVGALRSNDDETAPMPTLADLPDLVRSSREHTDVRFEVVGPARSLSPVTELTIYRVVQEALTNVRKHAGPTARADVRIRYLEQTVEAEVSDDGHGLGSGSSAHLGLGMGQTGMRERTDALGGTIVMQPKTRGGYLVRVSLPAPSSPAQQPQAQPTPRAEATP